MRKISKFIIVAAAVLFAVSVYAQDSSRKVDFTGTQEVDISVGLPYASLFWSASMFGDALGGFNFIDKSDIVTGSSKTVLPVFRAEYGYNVLSWLNLGAGVNYSYGSYSMLYKEDNSYAWDTETHLATITFNVKFYWLNRKWVRMYSGIGVGLAVVNSNAGAENADGAAIYSTSLMPAIDLRLIGLTVGQKLYGRFEVGTLSSGLVTAGIGYRF